MKTNKKHLPLELLINNLKHAAREGADTSIGGGIFSAKEIRAALKILQEAYKVPV